MSRKQTAEVMNARTKTLFHFTKSFDTLLLILENGFWPQYSIEETAWIGGAKWPKLAWPMVSFCDIPLSRIREHTDFYGCYGIGMSHSWARECGLNPVFYVASGSFAVESVGHLVLTARTKADPDYKTSAMFVLAHCKPLRGSISVAGKPKSKDFYAECEWRYVPFVGEDSKYGFLMGEQHFRDQSSIQEANKEGQNDKMLKFGPDEVRYLIVKSEDEIPKLTRSINDKLAGYSADVLDVLKTRIVALDELSQDI